MRSEEQKALNKRILGNVLGNIGRLAGYLIGYALLGLTLYWAAYGVVAVIHYFWRIT